MSTLDELKGAWVQLSERLERVETELKVDRARSASRWLWAQPAFELAMGLVAAVWLGRSYAGHGHQPLYLVSVALLHLGAIASMIANARQLAMLGDLSWSAPVAQTTRRLEALRAARLRLTQWTLILAPLVWPPMATVLCVWFFRTEPNLAWLAGNVVFGVAATLALVAVARRVKRARAPWVRRVLDDVAGRRLTAALGFLREVEAFEKS